MNLFFHLNLLFTIVKKLYLTLSQLKQKCNNFNTLTLDLVYSTECTEPSIQNIRYIF